MGVHERPGAWGRRAWMTGVAALVAGCAGRRRRAPAGLDLPADAWRRDLHELVEAVVDGHVAPFHTLSESALRAEVAALDARIPTLETVPIVAALRGLVASIGDAHTRLYTLAAFGPRLPIATRRDADGAHVYGARHAEAELLGARVLEVDGRPVQTVVRGLERIVSADTPHGRTAEATTLLVYPRLLHALGLSDGRDGARLLLQRSSGAATERGLVAIDDSRPYPRVSISERWDPVPLAERQPLRAYWYEYLPQHSALYLRYRECRQMRGESFGRFARSFLAARRDHEPERIVLDLRGNHGGDSSYLQSIIRPLARRPSAPVVCLVDQEVYSSGSMNAAQIQRRLGAVVVGTPTGGCPYTYGELGLHTLTRSGLVVSYSTRRFDDPEGRPIGPVVPDVEIPRRFDDHAAGRDRALAYALRAPLDADRS